jgi:hypothetical protein
LIVHSPDRIGRDKKIAESLIALLELKYKISVIFVTERSSMSIQSGGFFIKTTDFLAEKKYPSL